MVWKFVGPCGKEDMLLGHVHRSNKRKVKLPAHVSRDKKAGKEMCWFSTCMNPNK